MYVNGYGMMLSMLKDNAENMKENGNEPAVRKIELITEPAARGQKNL